MQGLGRAPPSNLEAAEWGRAGEQATGGGGRAGVWLCGEPPCEGMWPQGPGAPGRQGGSRGLGRRVPPWVEAAGGTPPETQPRGQAGGALPCAQDPPRLLAGS